MAVPPADRLVNGDGLGPLNAAAEGETDGERTVNGPIAAIVTLIVREAYRTAALRADAGSRSGQDPLQAHIILDAWQVAETCGPI